MADENRLSFSQCGEDRIVSYILNSTGRQSPIRYADFGAAFPSGDNNTYLFYTRGGSGLLVEADSSYLPLYSEMRPRDAVEAVAVVPERMRSQESIRFHAMENRGWSTISEEHVRIAAQLNKGGIRETLTVPCRTINEILAAHFPDGNLDLLSMDLEGIDTEVLAELDLSRFQPGIIIVENPFGWSSEIMLNGPNQRMLVDAGYHLFACTFINFIFVHGSVMNAIQV